MTDLLGSSAYFGLLLSLGAYGLGLLLQRRWKLPIFNPLLVAIVVVAVVLLLLDLDYGSYSQGANLLNYLLTPATVCLAVPLYEQFSLLRRHGKAVLLGIAAGVLAGLVTILVLAWLFSLDHSAYVTLLPKSITTAIGIGVATELGGRVPIAVAVIILTGILGSIVAEKWLALLRITHPVARGIALGSSAHAIGTAKAMEMGAVEGSMSSLSIVVCGVCTVVLAPLFAAWL